MNALDINSERPKSIKKYCFGLTNDYDLIFYTSRAMRRNMIRSNFHTSLYKVTSFNDLNHRCTASIKENPFLKQVKSLKYYSYREDLLPSKKIMHELRII